MTDDDFSATASLLAIGFFLFYVGGHVVLGMNRLNNLGTMDSTGKESVTQTYANTSECEAVGEVLTPTPGSISAVAPPAWRNDG